MDTRTDEQTYEQTRAPMLAYHSDPKIKRKYLARVRRHRRADELIRGTGWDGRKGCAVGCTLNRYEHAAYETELGIPTVLAHLEDAIFEGLPGELAMEWPDRFLSAIPIGADLKLVSAGFMIWLLEEELKRWASPASAEVVHLYRLRIAGQELAIDHWVQAAEAAAWAARAAAGAARAAAGAAGAARAAAGAAWAARAAAWAAEAAAWAARAAAGAAGAAAWAAEAAAGAAAWAAEAAARAAGAAASYERMADKLIELLSSIPVQADLCRP